MCFSEVCKFPKYNLGRNRNLLITSDLAVIQLFGKTLNFKGKVNPIYKLQKHALNTRRTK